MSTSSFYDSNYDRSKFIDKYDITLGKGKSIFTITIQDMLSTSYLNLIDQCSVQEYYVWQAGDNLPNLAYAFYKNTTAWWIIARKNGIINPFSLKVGDVIAIPNLASINSAIKGNKSVSELNTEVTF